MKLSELHFKNYRLFKNLDIQGLKQINLIAGKNNTGKTALLEGIRIWAANGDSTVVNNVLHNRGEFIPSRDSSYDVLFNQETMGGKTRLDNLHLEINNFGIFLDKPKRLSTEKNYRTTLDGQNQHLLDADKVPDYPNDQHVVYIPFLGEVSQFQKLWENINLTHREEDVLDILRQTILSNIKRIGFSQNQFRVLLNSYPDPVPIGQLGDGVQRILSISLALANAQNKILLIDEFESGLHHSIQKELWGVIFKYARIWNIQVFVTTHSEDVLKNFFYVGSQKENKPEANFIRLQYDRKGILEAISYDIDRLEKALELELEIR